jgi:hypothetical protein
MDRARIADHGLSTGYAVRRSFFTALRGARKYCGEKGGFINVGIGVAAGDLEGLTFLVKQMPESRFQSPSALCSSVQNVGCDEKSDH